MVLVMCANAGVDRTYEVEGFSAGAWHRPSRSWVSAGGKGLNVARALLGLGVQTLVTGFLGGFPGDFIYCDLDRLGLSAEFSRIREDSRTTLSIVDPTSGRVTRLDEAGPTVSGDEVELLLAQWEELLRYASQAVISGNPPPGVRRDFHARLIAAAHDHSVPLLLDVHDEPLADAVLAGPDVITPNLEELSALANHPLSSDQEVVDYSRDLNAAGVGVILTTLGAGGALVTAASDEAFRVSAPAIEVVSTVGAGDCAVAGWVAATEWELDLAERARWAVAAGSAGCLHTEAANIDVEEVTKLVNATSVEDVVL